MEALAVTILVAIIFAMALAIPFAGCWDPAYGPAIRNGYDETVHVAVQFRDGKPLLFDLVPGQTYWQRTKQRNTSGLVIVVTSSTGVLRLDEAALSGAGFSGDKPILVISPSGAHAER